MAAESSRSFTLKYSSNGTTYTAVAGVRTKSMTINGTSIDITTDDESGVQTLLDDVGVLSYQQEVGGVLKDNTLVDLASGDTAGAALHFFRTEFQGKTYTGKFKMTGFTAEGGGSDGAVEFSATLTSSGAITVA